MKYIGFLWIITALTLGGCAEDNTSENNKESQFTQQLQQALNSNNLKEFQDLLITKDALIKTLVDDDNKDIYLYDIKYFNMANSTQNFKDYKNVMHNSYKAIGAKINHKKIKESIIKKDTVQKLKNKIYLKGILLIADKQNIKTDSIHFEAIRLLNDWKLTTIY